MAAGGMSNQLMYVARVLRDQLDDFLEGTAEALRLRSTLEFAAQHILVSRAARSKNVVGSRRKRKERATTNARRSYGSSSSEEILNPRLWSTLPSMLVNLIFGHLPLPDMKLLRLLSKEWKRRIDTDFRQVWGEACTSKFALICPAQIEDSGVAGRNRQEKFWVNAFDLRTNKWYSALFKAHPDWYDVTVCACDGGLICFMYILNDRDAGMQQNFYYDTWGNKGVLDIVRFAVWNPATDNVVVVPLLDEDSDFHQSKFHRLHTHPGAVKLSVDRESKHYKLMVVNSTGVGVKVEVSVYDSKAGGGWNIQEEFPDDTNLLGYSHRCALKPLERIQKGNWIYDFSKKRLMTLIRKGELTVGRNRITLVSIAVTEDHGFILRRNVGLQIYQIFEYCYEAGNYREVKVQSCSPLDNLPQVDHYTLRLHSCQGFLMVSAYPKSFSSSHQRHWFCDLCTGRWRRLPPLAEDKKIKVDDVMCELQWNIIPKEIVI